LEALELAVDENGKVNPAYPLADTEKNAKAL
jgi:hypothetical protein